MTLCANCKRKIGFFEKSYDYEEDDGSIVKFCAGCNEKAESEEKRKAEIERTNLISRLEKDPIIHKFTEKYFALCLSLTYTDYYELDNSIDGSVEYNEIVDIICAEKLSGFRELFIRWRELRSNLDGLNIFDVVKRKAAEFANQFEKNKGFDKQEPELPESFYFVTNDLTQFSNTESWVALSKFVDLILKKYGDIDAQLLLEIIGKGAAEYVRKTLISDFSELNTEEEVKKYILEHYPAVIENIHKYWFNVFILILLDVIKEKNMTFAKSTDELRSKLKQFQKESDLNDFEKDLLDTSKPEYTIEDIDSMNGFEFESFLEKLFLRMGYKVVKTKLSGDQGADLVLEKRKRKTVVQAKRHKDKISNKAIQEVTAAIKYYNADDGMLVTNSELTTSAKKLAESNEITVVDREKLKRLIKENFEGYQKDKSNE